MNLGLRAAADKLGISHVALLKHAKNGNVKRNADGTFNVEACARALKQNVDQAKRAKEQKARSAASERKPAAAPAPESKPASREPDPQKDLPDPNSLAEAQRQREWIRVEKERLNLEKQRLSVVELTPVNAYVAGMILRAREELMRMKRELRDELAQENDPVEVEAILGSRIDQILEKMAEYRPAAASAP